MYGISREVQCSAERRDSAFLEDERIRRENRYGGNVMCYAKGHLMDTWEQ
jgi:hypothetical protein